MVTRICSGRPRGGGQQREPVTAPLPALCLASSPNRAALTQALYSSSPRFSQALPFQYCLRDEAWNQGANRLAVDCGACCLGVKTLAPPPPTLTRSGSSPPSTCTAMCAEPSAVASALHEHLRFTG